MLIEFKKELLLDHLSLFEKIAQKHATLPVLECVLLEAEKSTLSLRATNLDVGVRTSYPVVIKEPGVLAVPARLFANVVQSAPSGAVITVEAKKTSCKVSFPGTKAVLTTHNTSEFPILPKVPQGSLFKIQAALLLTTLKNVVYSASTSTIKPELASIFLHPNTHTLIAATTDSFRLAEKRVPLPTQATHEPLLLPVRVVPEFMRILELVDGEVECVVDEHQMVIEHQNIYFTTRLVDGTFPDYEQIIPKEFATEVTMLQHDVITAFKRVGIFTNSYNQITLTINTTKKKVTITAQNDVVGEVELDIDAAISGKDISINFNQRYITDVFQSLATDSITFSLAGSAQPMVVRGVGDTTFRYLVMPMNR